MLLAYMTFVPFIQFCPILSYVYRAPVFSAGNAVESDSDSQMFDMPEFSPTQSGQSEFQRRMQIQNCRKDD